MKDEWLACQQSFPYFVDNYVFIYDATAGAWIPFRLWDSQMNVAYDLSAHLLNVILKARQLGLTWLVLSFILWLMLFHPAVTILVFSRREIEAIYLLDKRLKGMYQRLPEWMNVKTIVSDSAHIWELSNGSVAYAFPTSAGDSYTATLAFVDEADLVPDLENLMLAVKPTIDGGGRMILLSRSDKERPNSPFKMIYKAAKNGENGWNDIFLPWFDRPTRTQQWYDNLKNDFIANTGSEDGLFEQYPATPEEALAPKSFNKRIPYGWLKRCYEPMKGIDSDEVRFLKVYKYPELVHTYIISADPAEGNPTSDDSSAHVFDALTLEEVARLSGKIEPNYFGDCLVSVSAYYNNASIMVERNNHGHAVIGRIRSLEKEGLLLKGQDGKHGWPETTKTKALMYDTCAQLLKNGVPTFHSESTFLQLASIEGSTLKAPEGEFDDEAVSYALGLTAATVSPPKAFGYRYASTNRHSKGRRPSNSSPVSSPNGRRSRLPAGDHSS